MDNKYKIFRKVTIFLTALTLTVSGSAQEWPQVFGPGRNNISAQKGILRSSI